MQRVMAAGVLLSFALASPAHAQGTPSPAPVAGLFTVPPVLGAPFSADATTTVTRMTADGSQVTRSGVARVFRDSRGRVRVEQDVTNGIGDDQRLIVVDPDPGDGRVWVLHPAERAIGVRPRSFVAKLFNDGNSFAVPRQFTPDQSSRLKERAVAGYWIYRVKDQRAAERTVSPDLQVLTASRYVEPGVGVFEYRLTNIRRAEPAAHLFELPSDYTLLGAGEGRHFITLHYEDW